jgi:hypothetical protein
MINHENLKMDGYIYRDNVFTYEGSVSVEENINYSAPWRINVSEKELFPFLIDKVGKFCSGVRLCFTTDAEIIALQVAELEEPLILDVFVDGKFNQQIKVSDLSQVYLKEFHSGLKAIEIWLTQNQTFKLKMIFVSEGARISKTLNTQKKWIHYGSSISQSNAADSPSMIWASMTAHLLDLHLTNLGFSGECVFDPMVAINISELPADYITLKLGINTYTGLQTRRMFAPSVIGFIKIIREKHPTTPLTVISPIYCEPREIDKGMCGLSLKDMRVALEGIVDIFKSYGDRNIYYLSGLQILGQDNKHHMPDNLHPDAEAQYIIADNFISKVFYKMPGIV